MKIKYFLAFFIVLFAGNMLHSQTLVNALSIKSVNLELNGIPIESEASLDRMVISHNKSKISIYENNDMTYFFEYKYKQCGKKASLTGKTFVELKDGKVLDGQQIKMKQRMDDNQPGWIIGLNQDVFEKNDDSDLAFKADFEYEIRYKN